MCLKNDIEKQLGIPTKIKMGAPGAMDIFLDGQKIFSYKETGRMPAPSEVIRLIEARRPA